MNRTRYLVVFAVTVLAISAASAFGAASDADSVVSRVIHTAKTSLAVNQLGQVGDQVPGSSFTYFANPTKDYLRDGSLILGNAADNLSWSIYRKTQPAPSPDNPYGPMLPMSDLTIDSTSNPSYMVAFGKGTNRDSTIGFDVTYYAPKHIDSSDFYIARYKIYKGVNDPLGTYYPLTVAFAADWDIASDSGANNSSGVPGSGHIYDGAGLYQRGETSTAMQQQFGAVTLFFQPYDCHYLVHGGFVWDNLTHVYPFSGFQADSVWSYAARTNGLSHISAITDLSTVLVIGTDFSIDGAAHDTLRFFVVLSGQLNGSLTGLQGTIHQAYEFLCTYVPDYPCAFFDCIYCGDANCDGTIDIADAVFLITYIFKSGPPPGDCMYLSGKGDANGDLAVDIADAVYLISYIFKGGYQPHCNGM